MTPQPRARRAGGIRHRLESQGYADLSNAQLRALVPFVVAGLNVASGFCLASWIFDRVFGSISRPTNATGHCP